MKKLTSKSSISTTNVVKTNASGPRTVACVIAGPQIGSFHLEDHTAIQYVALGARVWERAA